MFESGQVKIDVGRVPGVQQTFTFAQAAEAYTTVAAGKVLGKLAMVPAVAVAEVVAEAVAGAGGLEGSVLGTSCDGIGGWGGENGTELRLLVSAFSPLKETAPGAVRVEVAFTAPPQWTRMGTTAACRNSSVRQIKYATYDMNTSTYNILWREAKAKGWLADPSDTNVYRLSHMLTREGLEALETERGAAYLAMQRSLFAPSEWGEGGGGGGGDGGGEGGGGSVTCSAVGACVYAVVLTPPAVIAAWVRQEGCGGGSGGGGGGGGGGPPPHAAVASSGSSAAFAAAAAAVAAATAAATAAAE